jgi:hypothetical protein
MDIQTIVSDLKGERSRIDQAISALEGLTSTAPRRGRPPKATTTGGKCRRMSRTQAHLRRYEAAMGEMEGKVCTEASQGHA